MADVDRDRRRITFIVEPAEGGARLDRVLTERLMATAVAAPTRAAVQRLIVSGSVTVNGRVERRPSCVLQFGYRLVCDTEPAGERGTVGATSRGASAGPAPQLPLDASVVLYEDEWLIVVNKPAGLPTHATIDPRRPHLHGEIAALLARRAVPDADRDADGHLDAETSPSVEGYLGVHHRLDRDTSGVVLFTKDRSVNAAVGAAFAERRVSKHYLALCREPATKALGPRRAQGAPWLVRNHLGRVSARSEAARYGVVHTGGDLAETEFRVLEARAGRRLLVEARPLTGRTHQIRVHLAYERLPIIGDVLYGGEPGPRVLLHAWRLTLEHPVHGTELCVESPLPPDLGGPASQGGSGADRDAADPARTKPRNRRSKSRSRPQGSDSRLP